jgi:O-antigen ligase
MISTATENVLGKALYIGTPFVTIFVLINTVTDPVNVTKLFALSGLAGGLLLPILVFGRTALWKKYSLQLSTVLALLVFSLISIFVSVAPISQGWYGVYGRNTGFLTYFFLSICFLAALLVSEDRIFAKFILGFFSAGIINVVYCLWVLIFGDFIGWNNPYGNILGLFGNPDFISAFLGMFIVGIVAYILQIRSYKKIALSGLVCLLAFYEIVQSHAIQGIVVCLGGIAFVLFFFLRSKFHSVIVTAYSTLIVIVGVLAILGTLQKGPLSFVYKKSVSLRGSYWKAGINMGSDNPLFGVGMDNYGDWYRRARPPVALIDTPAIHVMSNVAHNVVIDFFAFGGFPLLISYVLFTSFGLVAIIRWTKNYKNYDPIFVTLASVWICYQVQSLISINQIGLAIWGWTITGLLIAYERKMRNRDTGVLEKPKRQRNSVQVISPQLLLMLGILAGLLMSWPALNSDAKFFTAMNSKQAEQLERALIPSLVNPASSFKYTQAVDLFMRSNLLEPALKYSRMAVSINPDSFDSWRQLYFLDNSTKEEKKIALQNMKRLDPMNPDVLATA